MHITQAPKSFQAPKLPKSEPSGRPPEQPEEPSIWDQLGDVAFDPTTALQTGVIAACFSSLTYGMASSAPAAALALGAVCGGVISFCTGDRIDTLGKAARYGAWGATLGAVTLGAGALGPAGVALASASVGIAGGLGLLGG